MSGKCNTELSLYFSQIDKYPLLSKEEEYRLAKKAKDGDKKAKEKLIASNLRFVVQVAHSFSRYTAFGKINMLDLVQEGNVGLLIAFEKFNPDLGLKFITYAVHWIKAKMRNVIIKDFSLVKVGSGSIQRVLFYKISQMNEIINEKNIEKREILRKKLSETTGVSVQDIMKMEERLSWKDTSISSATLPNRNEPLEESRLTLEQRLADPNQLDIISLIGGKQLAEIIDYAMKDLTIRETDIIKRRFLTTNQVPLSQIGREYNLTRERIRQIQVKALDKIKSSLRGNNAVMQLRE